MPGSPNAYIDSELPVYIIKNGAHHLDLREPQAGDEDTGVNFVREQQAALIDLWIKEYKGLQIGEPKPLMLQ